MCVNDVLTCGAEPALFLDYIAVGRLDPERAADVVEGVAAGCREAGCALLGGETAELPDMYGPDDLDLAGFALGIVERDAIIDGSAVAAGDAVIGLAASGVHANGFTLVRRLLERAGLGPGDAPGDLLAPTRIYARAGAGLRAACDVRAMAHITGGGLPGNLPRVLPAGLGRARRRAALAGARGLRVAAGLGVERARDAPRLQRRHRIRRSRARGRGGGGDRGLRGRGLRGLAGSARSCRARASSTCRSRSAVRIGVLVSGSGSNLQALIDARARALGDDRGRVLEQSRGLCARARPRTRASRAPSFHSRPTPASATRATVRWPTGLPSGASAS